MPRFGITGEGPVGRQDGAAPELDETFVGEGEPEDDAPAYPPGTLISRYVVLGQIGAGGMGVVLAAFDPELGRRIALKILRPRRAKKGGERTPAASRLIREAQAIARLSHPNVVSVHDVGRHGEAVFVAMELIEGVTLTAWLGAAPRTLEEILDVFAKAGRGLAAAHKAGLVHRDFKPDNVLVSPDGRVRVLDFGLARADPSQVSMPSLDEDAALAGVPSLREWSDSDVLMSPLTRDDAVVGTPRYMAPEQHAGLQTDGRSDQFSFCVALYQALWGQDPFPAQTLRKLVTLKAEGRIAPPPRKADVPQWLEDAVLRGLAPRPDARFESMDALVDVLAREREVKRRRWLSVAAGVVLLGGAVLAVSVQQAAAERPCQGSEAHMADVWNDERRTEVGAAIEGTALPYAAHTWAEVEHRVDAYVADWVQMHRDACEATRVRGEQSEELLDRRMACLQGARSRLRALVDVLRAADAGVVEKATQAVATLPRVEACAELEQLTREVAPAADADTRAAVDDIRDRLASAAALESAGKYAEGLAIAEEALGKAEAIDYPPVRADVLDRLGGLLERTGDYAGAERRLREALWIAIRAGHDTRAAAAASGLVSVVGDRLARHDEGLLFGEHAAAILDRLEIDGLPRSRLDNNIGNVLYRKGDHEEARARYERAIALREKISGAEDPSVGLELINLGNAQLTLGEHEAALATFTRSRAIIEAALGEGHPLGGVATASMGNVHQEENRPIEAQAYFEEALPVLEDAFGPEHPFVGITLLNVAGALHEQGRDDEALAKAERARSIVEASVGRAHPDYADVLDVLAKIHDALDHADDARDLWERALAVQRSVYGEAHPEVGSILSALGDLRRRTGEAAPAIEQLEEALSMLEETEADPREVARARFRLAQAELEAGGELAEARAKVRRAIEGTRAAGRRAAPDRAEMEAWLAAHPLSGTTGVTE
jgi:tetratricopeptide (TPR) repeat protein